jgi:hypothetical protein
MKSERDALEKAIRRLRSAAEICRQERGETWAADEMEACANRIEAVLRPAPA